MGTIVSRGIISTHYARSSCDWFFCTKDGSRFGHGSGGRNTTFCLPQRYSDDLFEDAFAHHYPGNGESTLLPKPTGRSNHVSPRGHRLVHSWKWVGIGAPRLWYLPSFFCRGNSSKSRFCSVLRPTPFDFRFDISLSISLPQSQRFPSWPKGGCKGLQSVAKGFTWDNDAI